MSSSSPTEDAGAASAGDSSYWPSPSVLTARLRRLITASQRFTKSRQIMQIHQSQTQTQQAMMLSAPLYPLPPTVNDVLNPKMAAKIERQQRSERRQPRPGVCSEWRGRGGTLTRCSILLRWTRREEADFYRVVSTFGVVFDPSHSRFDWTKFRAMARLHKKTDESLQKYLCAFTAMCRRVCRLPPKEGGGKPARTDALETAGQWLDGETHTRKQLPCQIPYESNKCERVVSHSAKTIKVHKVMKDENYSECVSIQRVSALIAQTWWSQQGYN